MSVLKICVGKKAEVPYYMEQLHMRIYSLEELACYIWENYSLLDESLLDGRLADWIEEECCMAELAHRLRKNVRGVGTLHSFAELLLSAVGLHDAEEIRYLIQQLKQYEGMDEVSRCKAKADRMFHAGGYLPALQEYMILVEWYRRREGKLDVSEREAYGTVLHNMGSCFARMFFYDAAADFFWQSYEVSGNQREQKYVLLCKKLLLSEEEYHDYLEKHMESACYEQDVDELVRGAEEKWHKTGNCIEMERAMSGKDFGSSEEFMKKQRNLVQEWKRQYDTHVLY